MYKTLLLVALCLWAGATVAHAQTGFNGLYSFPYAPAIYANCVFPTDTAYYVMGSSNENLIGIRQGANFIKLDLAGNQLASTKLLLDTCIFTPYPSCAYSNDGNLYVLANNNSLTDKNGLLFVTDTFPVIINYSSNGDTLALHKITLTAAPNISYNYIGFDLLFLPYGFMILAEKWGHEQGVNSALIDVSLLRFDDQFNLLWSRDYGIHPGGNNDDFWPKIVLDVNGYVLLYHTDHYNNNNYFNNIHLLKLDSLGNIISQSVTPYNDSYLAWDFIKTIDGDYAYCGYHGILDNDGYLYPASYVCKLDSNRIKVWERQFGMTSDWNQMKSISELGDGSLICAGNMGIKHPGLPDSGDVSGYLVKLSSVGDSLWMRHYTIIPTNSDIQTTWDMKPCPDGGFIFCGDAYDLFDPATYPQRAWVVKTDSFGCIVPGCQQYDAIHEPPSPSQQIPILAYPNPASSMVNVYLPPFASQVEGLSYTLTDMQGRRVKEWAADGPGGTTYMVPVGDLAAGVYVLTLWERGKVLGAKQLVIEH